MTVFYSHITRILFNSNLNHIHSPNLSPSDAAVAYIMKTVSKDFITITIAIMGPITMDISRLFIRYHPIYFPPLIP
jgi:hypothetical protein